MIQFPQLMDWLKAGSKFSWGASSESMVLFFYFLAKTSLHIAKGGKELSAKTLTSILQATFLVLILKLHVI